MMRFFCLVLALVLYSSPGWSQPAISGTSGTWLGGNTITVTGSGFGAKTTAKPYLWADFESGLQPTTLGTVTAWVGADNFAQSTTDCQSSGTGNCARSNQAGGCGACTLGVDYTAWNTPGQRIYLYRRVRMDFQLATTGNTQNWKILRMWPTDPDLAPSLIVASSNGRIFVDGITAGESGFWMGGIPPANDDEALVFPANTWIAEEFLIQASTAGTADGTLSISQWGNGGNKVTNGPLITRDVSGDGSSDLTRMYAVHHVSANNASWSPAYPAAGITTWADDVYVDTTWSRSIVCTASTWAACTDPVPQIPSAWSATSITLTAYQGSLGSFSGKYLYVCDPDNFCNANGFALSGGGGGGGTGGPAKRFGGSSTMRRER